MDCPPHSLDTGPTWRITSKMLVCQPRKLCSSSNILCLFKLGVISLAFTKYFFVHFTRFLSLFITLRFNYFFPFLPVILSSVNWFNCSIGYFAASSLFFILLHDEFRYLIDLFLLELRLLLEGTCRLGFYLYLFNFGLVVTLFCFRSQM